MNHLSYIKYFQIIFFFFCAVSHIYGQYPCQDCIVGNIGEEKHNLQGEAVRNRYHFGIDYNGSANDGEGDYGYHLRAIVGGMIYKITLGKLKLLVIDGVNHDFYRVTS